VGGRTGLYEFKDNAFVGEYNIDNSPLTSTLGNNHADAHNYTLVEGLTFDHDGNLWCVNGGTRQYSILKLGKDSQWDTFAPVELVNGAKGLKGLQHPLVDSRGYLWFINFHWEIPSFYCFDPTKGTFVNKWVSNIKNQDETQYAATPRCLAEDKQHNIWIGTDKGPFVIEADQVENGQENVVTQVKVPRNDGTDLADYLLSDIVVRSIVIDDGNRKWIGTQGNGLYLISADNNTELEHFTSENSPLLSDNIESLAWNPETGELFIGTDLGLCSYMSDATASIDDMSDESVYAFPNPVPSSYQGIITVRGLSTDSDVKVVTTSGRLVAQGRSNGGTFTWDGRDRQGHRVASGIYMIIAATSSGEKGAVCKIAMIK
jgi:ligand-binding sensor domain-containing protein